MQPSVNLCPPLHFVTLLSCYRLDCVLGSNQEASHDQISLNLLCSVNGISHTHTALVNSHLSCTNKRISQKNQLVVAVDKMTFIT